MLIVDAHARKLRASPSPRVWRCCMRFSGLFLFLLLLFSPLGFAQHSSSSSSGGSSAGSSGGGGGSHGGGSSGGSSASSGSSSHSSGSSGGGGHSSGAHISGGSSTGTHSTGGHSTSGQPSNNSRSMISHHSDIRESQSNNNPRFSHESTRVGQIRTAQPEKRGFFGFLRHPLRFRQPEPKPVTDLRHPVCLKGPCQVCPNGQISTKGGCGGGTGMVNVRNRNHWCSTGFMWNGGGCYVQSEFLDYCSAERLAMNRQAERLNGAQSLEMSACANSTSNECFDARGNRQQEERVFRDLQTRYQQCMRRSPNTFSLGGRTLSSYRRGLNFDPTMLDSMEFGTWQSY